MNKYRLLQSYDDFNEFKCLACKKDFIHRDRPTDWSCCPFCKVVWDGEFTKRNREPQSYSYEPDDSYDLLPGGGGFSFCRKPRLIIQARAWITRRLSPHAFATEECEPHWGPWRLVWHCGAGLVIEGRSSSVHMFDQFKQMAESGSYGAVRLVLQTGSDIKVIRESPLV